MARTKRQGKSKGRRKYFLGGTRLAILGGCLLFGMAIGCDSKPHKVETAKPEKKEVTLGDFFRAGKQLSEQKPEATVEDLLDKIEVEIETPSE